MPCKRKSRKKYNHKPPLDIACEREENERLWKKLLEQFRFQTENGEYQNIHLHRTLIDLNSVLERLRILSWVTNDWKVHTKEELK